MGKCSFSRLVPYPKVSGVITWVAAIVGLIGGFIDWGTWTGLQMRLSSAIPLHDEATIIRYSRTMFTFKIINSFVYTGLLYIILSYYFSTLNDPYKTRVLLCSSFYGDPRIWGICRAL